MSIPDRSAPSHERQLRPKGDGQCHLEGQQMTCPVVVHGVVAQTVLSAVSPTFLSAGLNPEPWPSDLPTARQVLKPAVRQAGKPARHHADVGMPSGSGFQPWNTLSGLTWAAGPGWNWGAPLALVNGIALSESMRFTVDRRWNRTFPVVAVRETALTPPDRNLLLNRMVCLWPDPPATPTGDIPLVNSRDVHSRSISAVSRTATTA
jgi:hypothetical protein